MYFTDRVRPLLSTTEIRLLNSVNLSKIKVSEQVEAYKALWKASGPSVPQEKAGFLL